MCYFQFADYKIDVNIKLHKSESNYTQLLGPCLVLFSLKSRAAELLLDS